jgi:auxin-responsive protein IAA
VQEKKPLNLQPLIALPAQASGEEQEVITGVLNGSGEYTLVYEDEEGDQMLVGDVPWE